MANLAWRERLRGDSLKRNSLLRPFDIVLEHLERYSDESPERLRAAAADEIFAYLDRLSPADRRLGRRAAEATRTYVDLFFDRLLDEQHRGDATRLLGRERFLRSAYHHYIRQAIPDRALQKAEASPDLILDDTTEPLDDRKDA
jgi:hypothetical protein